MDRASRQVTAFLDQMSDVKCSEHVTQLKLDKNGHTSYQENSSFDYLVLLQGSGDELLLNESRLGDAHNEQRNKKNVPLLVTNGFSMLMLIFHPYYRNSFEFAAMPDEIIAGHRTAQVRFTHIPGTRTPAALAVRGREFPLELTGTAWIEPETGQVAKLKIGLAKDMSDVGLKSLTAEIDYDTIQLPGWTQAYRFPTVATVEVETLRQRWRNVHRFSNYKRFLVDTSVSVAEPGAEEMSAPASIMNYASVQRAGERAHRMRLHLAAVTAVVSVVALAVYGWNYYLLAAAERPFSPKHELLKPSGSIAIKLGIAGVLLFMMIFLYPLRKRIKWLGRIGSAKHWLDFHVIAGLTAPVLIAFHASFKFRGIAGIAFWIMLSVAISGVIGRYIYAQIPRSLSSAELSLKELAEIEEELSKDLSAQSPLSAQDFAPLLQVPTPSAGAGDVSVPCNSADDRARSVPSISHRAAAYPRAGMEPGTAVLRRIDPHITRGSGAGHPHRTNQSCAVQENCFPLALATGISLVACHSSSVQLLVCSARADSHRGRYCSGICVINDGNIPDIPARRGHHPVLRARLSEKVDHAENRAYA